MDASEDRQYWVRQLQRVAEPVLQAAADRQLSCRMPAAAMQGSTAEARQSFARLEAVARLLCGIAPWLEAELGGGGEEAVLQQRYRELAASAMDAISDPHSPDLANWDQGDQPLVDAAFLAHATLRAPTQLWARLGQRVRDNVLTGLRRSRTIMPALNNWMLFLAMVDARLICSGEAIEPTGIGNALALHEHWYKGDGAYGDGPEFHWDFYNSFVIQPMMLEILEVLAGRRTDWDLMRARVLARARRYAAVQERLIAPDGTFPVLGRSLCYRCGAFQHLAHMAQKRELPAGLSPAQVRGALTAVIRRTLEAPGTFDAAGWLRVGLCGHQPALGERYISTGSLYLCATVFLPLGLGPRDPFWSSPGIPWTSRRAWSGEDLPADHAFHG